MDIPDIDLDVKDWDKSIGVLPNPIRASQLNGKGFLVSHKTGLYFQSIPVDPVTGLASFPYDVAEELEYYKIDLIPYHVYDRVESNEQLNEMVEFAESDGFPWDWFLQKRFYKNNDPSLVITQLGRHYYLCEQYPPSSVEDVAILNALIRPRKKYLIGEDWDKVKDTVWKKLPEEEKDSSSYFFKKSHAIAFAMAILVHMQIIDKVLSQDDQSRDPFYD